MAEATLIWLTPGALTATEPAAHPVYWREADGSVRGGTLAQAIRHPGASVRLVLSAADVLLTEVNLNRRQARHLQRVLPWMLEDQLIGQPEQFWFASGRPMAGRYPVVACDKSALLQLVAVSEELGAQVAGVAVDAQLLAELAPARIALDEHSLVLADAFQGLVIPAAEADAVLALLGLDSLPDQSRPRPELFQIMQTRVHGGHSLELLQGDLRPAEQGSGPLLSGAWRQLAVLAAACVATVVLLLALQTWRYQSAAESQWQQAADLYNQLFPGDRASALLASQFRNRLGQLGGAASGGFMALMMPVGESLGGQHSAGLTARRIQYDERENALTLDVEAGSYDSLEALQGRIGAAGLEAEIANYRSQGEKVTARLRVTTGS
jgi:general secretion pathway protein L